MGGGIIPSLSAGYMMFVAVNASAHNWIGYVRKHDGWNGWMFWHNSIGFTATLLQKIEELTLYIIELHKRLEKYEKSH